MTAHWVTEQRAEDVFLCPYALARLHRQICVMRLDRSSVKHFLYFGRLANTRMRQQTLEDQREKSWTGPLLWQASVS